MRILIADDESTVRSILVDFCEKLGCTADSVIDGEAATILSNSLNGKYRLIFLDLIMPGWDGYDTLMTYLGSKRKVVIIPGALSEEMTKELEEHPCVLAILPKPFDFKRLAKIIVDARRGPPELVDGNIKLS
jgi:DNA-binding response OmpR family regulator